MTSVNGEVVSWLVLYLRWGQALGSEWYETRIEVKNHKCSLDFDSETIVSCFVVQTCESMKAHVTCLQFPRPHGNEKIGPSPRARTMRSL